MDKLQELIKAAKAATPGPWWSGKCEPTDGHALAWVGTHFVDCGGGWRNYKEQESDATFIALTNPVTILELCDLLEKAEAALMVIEDGIDECWAVNCPVEMQIFRAALAAIKQWKGN